MYIWSKLQGCDVTKKYVKVEKFGLSCINLLICAHMPQTVAIIPLTIHGKIDQL